jgi:hypothetical protein
MHCERTDAELLGAADAQSSPAPFLPRCAGAPLTRIVGPEENREINTMIAMEGLARTARK